MHRPLLALLALALLPGFVCANQKPDAVGGGDERLDDQSKGGGSAPEGGAAESCGPDGTAAGVLADARPGGALRCIPATVSRDTDGEVLFQGHANKQGQLMLRKTEGLDKSRMVAEMHGSAPPVRASI